LLNGVSTAQSCRVVAVERLDAETESIHSSLLECLKSTDIDTARVDLDGDLSAAVDRQGGDDLGNDVGGCQRRCPATKIEAVCPTVKSGRCVFPGMGDAREPSLIVLGVGEEYVECTVGAACLAPGCVHINAKPLRREV